MLINSLKKGNSFFAMEPAIRYQSEHTKRLNFDQFLVTLLEIRDSPKIGAAIFSEVVK